MSKASSFCSSYNAKLPLPKNPEEDSQLFKVIKDLGYSSAALDGNDVEKEGEWVDSDGNKLSYTNWYSPNQPDNWNGEEHYLHYYKVHPGKFNDVAGYSVENVVCEKPLS